MDASDKVNANPTVYSPVVLARPDTVYDGDEDDGTPEPIDELEVFEMIRHINDPEHPLTLEQLNVAMVSLIHVDNSKSTVDLTFTPTIPHCSMATLIGLCIRVKLLRSLPSRFKVRVRVTPGTHITEDSINKQLGDKERVAAALENGHLLEVVNKCVTGSDHVASTSGPDGAASPVAAAEMHRGGPLRQI